MKEIIPVVIMCLVFVLGSMKVWAIEEPEYTLLLQEEQYELRDYSPYIIAETFVDAGFEEAGTIAFRSLFNYISGDNQSRTEVVMTAPVSQQGSGEEISMTAPVSQKASGGRWLVSFTMPGMYTMDSIPKPNDPLVQIRQVERQRMAAIRYTGLWRENSYQSNKQALDAWIEAQGLKVTGEAVWARYNAPFSLWFLRRNEILIPVSTD